MAAKIILISLFLLIDCVLASMYSSKLIHRFSDEFKEFGPANNGGEWPDKGSFEYYNMLLSSDAWRKKKMMKIVSNSSIAFPIKGSETVHMGNVFGWLHYTWIDIGMPALAFLVALDTGSDLLWVPCDCVQCAPLSANYYGAVVLLGIWGIYYAGYGSYYGPSCRNPKFPCPYKVNYLSENVSSSGLLVEDIIHLVTRQADASYRYIRSPVIIGCGKRQTGEYLEGIAPGGLLGLGVKEISVPSFLAKAGVIQNSFSLCFSENDSGRIYFGDQGPSTQKTTSLLSLDGKFMTYITGVEECCIGDTCLNQTSFKAIIDSGTSFTQFPTDVYGIVVEEFDRQMNSTKSKYDPWEYCYKGSSSIHSKVPSVVLKFGKNNSFVVRTPVIKIFDDQGFPGFCLAIQPIDSDIALIGQNYLRGYRIVFDRENLILGWSPSKCKEMDAGESSQNGSAPYRFPNVRHHIPQDADGSDKSAATQPTAGILNNLLFLEKLVLLLLVFHQLVCIS